MQKVKTWYICPAIPPLHVRGLGAWLKRTGILNLLGESSLAPES